MKHSSEQEAANTTAAETALRAAFAGDPATVDRLVDTALRRAPHRRARLWLAAAAATAALATGIVLRWAPSSSPAPTSISNRRDIVIVRSADREPRLTNTGDSARRQTGQIVILQGGTP